MRSNLITVVTTVASALLVAPVAVADAVQEQLRLMEQRMAEMEDRLQATSDELRSARATVETQQGLLTDAGLIESEDKGLRSSVGSFFEMVDVDGVAAASYNYRFIDRGDNDGGNTGARNDTYFTHPNGDAFQIDQLWITVDKTPTEESRGGFHADFVWGETADSQVNGSGNNSDGTAL
ncbi:MAG: hypothetical protein KC616_19540, partial [Myxococcales bacterium]|nr:hypothetical protein [Myxococcales bacterium]